MADLDYNVGGLRKKYDVRKADGTPVEDAARYFVLRYDTDPNARAAMEAYAIHVSTANPRLAADIWAALRDVEKKAPGCLSCTHCVKFGADTKVTCSMQSARVSIAVRSLAVGDHGWPHSYDPGVLVYCDSHQPVAAE